MDHHVPGTSSPDHSPPDPRIPRYIEAAHQLEQGHFEVDVPTTPPDEIGQLGAALNRLAQRLDRYYRELRNLGRITTQINAGLMLDDVLENVYRDFRSIIPYNRIGFSLLTDDGEMVRARWAKTDRDSVKLGVGYEAPIAGSSLQTIMQTGQPRIINDLVAYLAKKPGSESTQLIVEEGYRSSLTCPLIANGVPIGFMFFSHVEPNTYADAHVELFQSIAGQLAVIVDKGRLVSDLAGKTAKIERQNEELRRLDELKNTFLGMAAHDLRNPIAVIQMGADLLRENIYVIGEEEVKGMLNDMVDQTEHMLNLLSELLDVAEIESGNIDLILMPIDLQEFLEGAVRRHSRLSLSKGTQIVLEAAPAGTIRADPNRLRQVIDNLISNAVKYSPAGSTVWVYAERRPTEWFISVRDQGPGILPEDRARLFKEFARLSARPTGGEKSTGLGLAISWKVVDVHGGVLDVESEPGEGATFWFTLPAGPE
jgi:signal transduction histidine kinase